MNVTWWLVGPGVVASFLACSAGGAITTHGVHVLRDFTTDPKIIVAVLKQQDNQPNSKEPTGSTGVAVFDQSLARQARAAAEIGKLTTRT